MYKSKKKQLFDKLAIAMNTVDIRTAEKFYYDFIKFVINQTKEKGVLQLPDFGTFRMGIQKGRMGWMPRTGERRWVESSFNLRFKSDYKVRAYVNDRLQQ